LDALPDLAAPDRLGTGTLIYEARRTNPRFAEKQERDGSSHREEDRWPDPIDILADPHLTGLASVDETCLPGSVHALADAEARRLQVDASGLAALTIGTCSAVIPDDWRVRLKVNDKGWVERPCIWTAVVAESGRKKTDQFRTATRGVAKIEQALHAEHEKAMARHRAEHEAWKDLPKSERGPEPKPPAEARLATDDFTIEVLSDLLQPAFPR
jgi:hypothetical protein